MQEVFFRLKRPGGVLLDFDGVVADSLQAHLDAWSKATKEIFGSELDRPEALIGRSTAAIAGIIAAKFNATGQAKDLSRAKWNLLLKEPKRVELLPGARAFIESCSQNGIPLAIASNSPRSFLESVLHAHHVNVAVLVGKDDVLSPKPAPDIFIEAANRLSIPSEARNFCWVFEDSEHGVRAGVAAGMNVCGVASRNGEQALQKAGAKLCVRDLQDALERDFLAT